MFETAKPVTFKTNNDGTYIIEGGDPEHIEQIGKILELAASSKTNILLGTVAERREIDGVNVTQNTLLVINDEGKIIHLRRKMEHTFIDGLSYQESTELSESVRVGNIIPQGGLTPIQRAYLAAEVDAQKSLHPVSLRTRTGDQFSILPVICQEMRDIEPYLSREWPTKIDILTDSMADSDNLNTQQEQYEANSFDLRKSGLNRVAEMLARGRSDNPKGAYLATNFMDKSANVFSLNTKVGIKDYISTDDVVLAKCTLGTL